VPLRKLCQIIRLYGYIETEHAKKINHNTQTNYQAPVVENTWYQILLRMIISAFLYRIFHQYSIHNQETGREAFEEQPSAQNSLKRNNTQKLIKYN